MPYLQVDVDAIDDFDVAARHAGIPVGDVTIGLLRLWRYCWKKKASSVERALVAGFFPGDPERVVVALTVSGFLAILSDALVRVRGAEKRLGLASARSEAGKKGGKATAESGKSLQNLRQHKPDSASVPASEFASDVASAVASEAGSNGAAKTEALTSSIQHPTPSIQEEAEEDQPPQPRAGVPFVVEAPTTPPETWLGDDFWRWAQAKRQKAGWIAEKPPHHRKVSAWWSEAHMSGADVLALKEAFYSFGNDAHWQNKKPPLPFAGFMDVWRSHLPRRKAS